MNFWIEIGTLRTKHTNVCFQTLFCGFRVIQITKSSFKGEKRENPEKMCFSPKKSNARKTVFRDYLSEIFLRSEIGLKFRIF
jgi:hypothetical protein